MSCLKSFRALRRRKIYQQVAKLEYPEFSTGMPMPIQVRYKCRKCMSSGIVSLLLFKKLFSFSIIHIYIIIHISVISFRYIISYIFSHRGLSMFRFMKDVPRLKVLQSVAVLY